uniref:PSI domain-containing protein n=1 Tax=viral metagenome TaxID=1070528 RepID=A0A6C0KVB4_9ZZZZ
MNFFILSFILLVISFFLSKSFKESFEVSTCNQQTSCQTCAGANGCSWCPTSNTCLKSTDLTTNNPDCNQNNTISSAFSCPSAQTTQPDIARSLTSDSLYQNQVADRVRPPNAYSNPDMEYSNETVMAELHDVREQIKSGQAMLPEVVQQQFLQMKNMNALA